MGTHEASKIDEGGKEKNQEERMRNLKVKRSCCRAIMSLHIHQDPRLEEELKWIELIPLKIGPKGQLVNIKATQFL